VLLRVVENIDCIRSSAFRSVGCSVCPSLNIHVLVKLYFLTALTGKNKTFSFAETCDYCQS